MFTYTARYWTGTTETVTADSLASAYAELGYSDADGTHLWETTGEVTNEHGDVCAVITVNMPDMWEGISADYQNNGIERACVGYVYNCGNGRPWVVAIGTVSEPFDSQTFTIVDAREFTNDRDAMAWMREHHYR